jgi:hypothetical protein
MNIHILPTKQTKWIIYQYTNKPFM